MAKKKPTLIYNHAGGIDLMVERDAGNEIRILTGKKVVSKKFWKDMQQLSAQALEALDLRRRKTE